MFDHLIFIDNVAYLLVLSNVDLEFSELFLKLVIILCVLNHYFFYLHPFFLFLLHVMFLLFKPFIQIIDCLFKLPRNHVLSYFGISVHLLQYKILWIHCVIV